MDKVKVGDKVRVVRPLGTEGKYKKGDVLTVRIVCESGIAVEETDMALLHREYELYEPIKVGDTVTLIDNFYNHEKFKADSRRIRKQIASLRNTELEVKDINKHNNRASTGKIDYSIPIELLEKVYGVDLVDDGLNAEWIATGVVDDSVVKGAVEPKKGDLFRVIGNKGTWNMFNIGDEVTFSGRINNDDFECQRGKHITQWVSPCDLAPINHRHTPEQIAEAQRIIGEIVAGFKKGQCFLIRDESEKELTIRYTAETADDMHTITAHCSPHDEFNRTIGIMVALCKATGRKLPDWI